jgi:Delta3-Delta2-enoyl-CoA isomerase
MGRTAALTVDSGIATLRLARPHGNAINGELVADLRAACIEIESTDAIAGVRLAAAGKLFCPGLDLQELVELDRPAMERFVTEFNACVLALYSISKPMVAAVAGHALAGGCVLAMTADRRVLADSARIGLNEVRVGVPFPFGVARILREQVPRAHLEEIVLLGNNYEGDEALRVGLAHELAPADRVEGRARELLAEFATRDLHALRVTKRYLRAETIATIADNEAAHRGEFLDGWFRAGTRKRVLTIVDELRRR